MRSKLTPEQKRERARAACRAWYHRNIEFARASNAERKRKLYPINRDKVLQRNHAWWEKNHELVKSKQKEYYEANRESRNHSSRAYNKNRRINDPEWAKRRREQGRLYYQANKYRISKRNREYYKSHPGLWIAKKHLRRKRELHATINPKAIRDFCAKIKSNKSTPCYYCGKKLAPDKVHFDHIMPLSRGGAHSVDNLCVSCARCNLSKHNNLIQDWFKLGQQVLSL